MSQRFGLKIRDDNRLKAVRKKNAVHFRRDSEREARPEKNPLLKQAKRRNLQPYISDKGWPWQL